MMRLIRHLLHTVPTVLTFLYSLQSNVYCFASYYRSGKISFRPNSVVGLVSLIKTVPDPTNKVFNAKVGRRSEGGGELSFLVLI